MALGQPVIWLTQGGVYIDSWHGLVMAPGPHAVSFSLFLSLSLSLSLSYFNVVL